MSGVVATVRGVALVGLDAREVRVEASVSAGIPAVRLVGLPDAAVREAADRVRTGVSRSDLKWPQERLVINLAPADLPKVGASFDLPMGLAVLAATGQVPPAALEDVWALGEVGLDGSVRATTGTLPLAAGARRLGARRLLVPDAAAREAALVEDLEVVPVRDLREVVALLTGEARPRDAVAPALTDGTNPPDLADVRGQALARRAVELSAAGGHHLLMSGPPGCGKTMLAHRLHGLLPPLELSDGLEVAAIQSLAGERTPDAPLSLVPPMREPHHSISTAGLVGGGSGIPGPGELTLAHHGVLVLDELLEAPRHVLDALRQPLERGSVVLTRSRARVRYPCRILLVAATNPCPCGDLGNPQRPCTCRPDRIERYRSRLSGPLLDRIELQVEVTPVERHQLVGPREGESTATVAARVAAAREIAAARWECHNAEAPTEQVRVTCSTRAIDALTRSLEAVGASARAFGRSLRVARTIADLDGAESIVPAHVEEAVAYRLATMAAPA